MTVNPNHHPAPITIQARRLEGKVVLITGASAGMGAAAVRRFAAEGHMSSAGPGVPTGCRPWRRKFPPMTVR